jgi:hypothetical protein
VDEVMKKFYEEPLVEIEKFDLCEEINLTVVDSAPDIGGDSNTEEFGW